MHVAYKYKLLPTNEQAIWLAQVGGSTRWLWNYMLDLNIKKYQEEKKFEFAFSMNALLPKLKKENDWLKLAPSQSLQQKCSDLDNALKRVWKSGFGFPKFKSKHRSTDGFRIPQVIANGKDPHIKVSEKSIVVPKIGAIRWKYHRPIPKNAKIKSVSITKDCDSWFVSVLCEVPEVPSAQIDKSRAVGIDLGVASFATLSNGTKIESQNFLKKKLSKLKKYQRKLRNKVKGSKNKRKAYSRVAKIHRDIRNARVNWLHHQSNELVNKYDLICIEDLKIKDLLQKKQLSRSIADQGWGIFVNQLIYKANARGKHVTKIGTYQPSTKACSCCGTIRKMKLSDRVYIYENPKCNDYLKTKDRDINAATNILFWGMAATDYGLFLDPNTEGTSEIYACGEPIAQCQVNDIEGSTIQESVRSLVVQ